MSRTTCQASAALAILMMLSSGALAQQPARTKPTDPSSTTQQPATSPSASTPLVQDQPAPASTPAKYPTGYVPVAGKKNKFDYVGPKTLVELPATPMLDGEGRQRLDPDGKPMFNPPVRQQRDKRGNPVFDDQGKPVMEAPGAMGFDEKGKKVHENKEKKVKMVSVSIERGTLTVDGMTGKAGLNYEIKDFRYLYLYAPWIGVTVVSNSPFPGAKEQKNAFADQTLTVTVDEHTLQLYSDKRLLGKKPESAFVSVDRSFKLPTRFPVIGYGETLKPPYAWPGSRENAASKGAVVPPPLPPSLRAVTLLQPCPAGQMRPQSGAVSPTDAATAQSCVPIDKALPAAAPAAAPPNP